MAKKVQQFLCQLFIIFEQNFEQNLNWYENYILVFRFAAIFRRFSLISIKFLIKSKSDIHFDIFFDFSVTFVNDFCIDFRDFFDITFEANKKYLKDNSFYIQFAENSSFILWSFFGLFRNYI